MVPFIAWTGAPNTQTLRLCVNSIETLDAKVFGGMKNLTRVELCSNALAKLPDAFQVGGGGKKWWVMWEAWWTKEKGLAMWEGKGWRKQMVSEMGGGGWRKEMFSDVGECGGRKGGDVGECDGRKSR